MILNNDIHNDISIVLQWGTIKTINSCNHQTHVWFKYIQSKHLLHGHLMRQLAANCLHEYNSYRGNQTSFDGIRTRLLCMQFSKKILECMKLTRFLK